MHAWLRKWTMNPTPPKPKGMSAHSNGTHWSDPHSRTIFASPIIETWLWLVAATVAVRHLSGLMAKAKHVVKGLKQWPVCGKGFLTRQDFTYLQLIWIVIANLLEEQLYAHWNRNEKKVASGMLMLHAY